MDKETGVKRLALTILMGLGLLAGTAGCGFQLRGQSQLPFESAYVEAAPGSILAPALRDALASQDKLAAQATGATVRLRLAEESRTKNILALSGGGKVREYRLTYRVVLVAQDPGGKDLSPPAEILLTRDYSYSDSTILAKQAEEASLYQAIEQDALRQVLRRLSYIKR